jgi:hypothetical protein
MENRVYKSLCTQIEELLELEPHTSKFDKCFALCVEHVLMGTSIKDFHSALKQVIDFKQLEITPSRFRLTLSKSGYILLNFRYYAINMALTSKQDDSWYEYYMHQFDIDVRDSCLMHDALFTRVSGRKTLRSQIRTKYKKSGYDYSPDGLREILDRFNAWLPLIKSHILRVIRKRLRFIIKTYNMTEDEFVSELLFAAIRAYYKSVPNKHSEEKQLNTIRSSVTNYAINLIKEYTSTKRERLVNEGEDAQGNYVFNLRVVSENQMRLDRMTEDSVEIPYDSMFCSALRIKQENQREIEFSIDQMIRRFGETSKRGRLVTLFFKPDCPLFNDWLQDNNYLRSEKTTQDFQSSKSVEEFLKIVAKYLDTTVETLRKVAMPSLARQLGLL